MHDPVSIASELRRQALELVALAEHLEGKAPVTTQKDAAPKRRDRLISVATAAKIACKGTSTIYRWAEQFPIGRRLPTGTWEISEVRLKAFLDGTLAACGQLGEVEKADAI